MKVIDLHPTEPPDGQRSTEPASGESTTVGTPIRLEFIDPGRLLLDSNVRLDPRLDKQFLASVRDLGVLVPVEAHRTADGQLHVLLGQRRTLAAVETGRAQIPVFVIDIPDDDKARDIARIVAQVAENDDRLELKGSERAGAFQQLSALGLTATQVARRTHRKVGEVRAGLTVASSEPAATALDRFDLTLLQAAALAEFDDDPDAVAELAAVAERDPEQFDHAVARLRDKRAEDAVRVQLTAELTGGGVRLLEHPPYGEPSIARLDVLQTADGVELNVDGHGECPGHAGYLRDNGSWGGKIDITPVYVCTDWRKQGHQHRLGTPITGLDNTGGVGMSEEAKTERRVVIANNKAWAAAQTVRRQWLTTFLSRRTAPKDAPQWIATTLASCTHEIRRALEDGHGVALTLLGLTDDQPWSPYRGRPHPVATAAATAAPARAGMLTLGLLLGAVEATVTREAWRRPSTTHQAYFTALRTWGYPLSEVEQLVLGPDDEPNPGIAGDLEPAGSGDDAA